MFQNEEGELQMVYKRVAVVEQFFHIIYRLVKPNIIIILTVIITVIIILSVHVESSGETPHLRGRAGKHCGQKRTYRAVSGILCE